MNTYLHRRNYEGDTTLCQETAGGKVNNREVAKAVTKTKTGKDVVVGEMSVEMMEVNRLARII